MQWIKINEDRYLNLANVTHIEFSRTGAELNVRVYFAYSSSEISMEYQSYHGAEARVIEIALQSHID